MGKRGGIPPVPSRNPQERQFMEALKEAVEVGKGHRGDPLDRYLSLRDLLDSGVAKLGGRIGGYIPGAALEPASDPDKPNLRTPDAPSGLVATKGLGIIFLTWDAPLYANHAHTNIYRHTEDNFSNATVITNELGRIYADRVPYEVIDESTGQIRGYFYWITFVSDTGIEGPPNAVNGTYQEPEAEPEYMLDRLTALITESQLHADLTSRIDLIDGSEALPGSVAFRVNEVTSTLNTIHQNLLEGLAEEARLRGAAIRNESVARASGDESVASDITALQAGVNNSANALSALTTRVSNAENSLYSQSHSITQLSNSLGNKASTYAVNLLTNRVSNTENSLSSHSSSITQLSSRINSNTSSIQEQLVAVNGIKSQWTIKTDVNGRVAGVGLMNDGVTSIFQILASNFSVIDPRNASKVILGTYNGAAVIDGAYIKSASIRDAAIGSLAVNKLTGNTASFVSANITNGSITNAKIASAAITRLKIANNSVTVPVSSTSYSRTTLGSSMKTIRTIRFYAPESMLFQFIFGCRHGTSSPATGRSFASWRLQLQLDGSNIYDSGEASGDTPTVAVGKVVTSGWHTLYAKMRNVNGYGSADFKSLVAFGAMR